MTSLVSKVKLLHCGGFSYTKMSTAIPALVDASEVQRINRTSQFYGPHREVKWQRFKESCEKDNVRKALSESKYGGEKDLIWITSTKESYQGHAKPHVDPRCHQSRDFSSFVLGFDKQKYLTTNQDYKPHPEVGNSKRQHTDNKQQQNHQSTHITDFCPKYNQKSNFPELSEYQLSFQEHSKKVRPKTLIERRKHTNELRGTHFSLGDCTDPNTSETKHTFSKVSYVPVDEVLSTRALETYSSRVFRAGDWNLLNRKLVQAGVTQRDFVVHPKYEPADSVMRKLYHRGTHFHLGSTSSKSSSIYQKEFMSSTGGKVERPNFASKPALAELFPSDYDSKFLTTQQDFYKNNEVDVLALRKEGQISLERVRKRHLKNSVPLLLQVSKDLPSSSQRLISITASDFQISSPPDNLILPPISTFHHASGEDHEVSEVKASYVPHRSVSTFLHACEENEEHKISEVKASFVPHRNVSRKLRNECRRRKQDNKSTHFVFGNDDSCNKRSQQTAQYHVHLSADPGLHPAAKLQPAGKGLPQKKIYSHVYPSLHALDINNIKKGYSSSESVTAIREQLPISVMKQDFQELSACDDVVDTTPVLQSHYFHMDNQFSGTQMSTTRMDFKAPESPCLKNAPV